MTTRLRHVSTRRRLLAAGIVAILTSGVAAVGVFARPELAPAAAEPAAISAPDAIGPDVVVFSFSDGVWAWGQSSGYVGYSIGTVSCNRGDTPLNWCAQTGGCSTGAAADEHPAIGQNLYRLKDGRFEQIGMSWLKHGFTSLNNTTAGCTGASAGSCVSPGTGNLLGVGCTDPYNSSLNGSRTRLGPHAEVNGTTGKLVIPHSVPGSSAVWEGRLKVATTDVDPTVNPPGTTTFWAEAQYIAGDDAVFGNGLNNASYQQVTVGASPSFPLTRTGSFVEKQPAINAWRVKDPTVVILDVDVAGDPVERYQVARKVTDAGGGLWHYEYAVRNHNSDRSARALTIDFPAPIHFSNIGFKDIEHHSGEPYATTDWSVSTTKTQVSWYTDTFAVNANANALRFATMFNFWFDADAPPGYDDAIQHTLELFKPGTAAAVTFNRFNGLFVNGFESGATNDWSDTN